MGSPDAYDLVANVLTEHLDLLHAKRIEQRMGRPNGITPLSVDSLRPEMLALAVRTWQASPFAVAT